MQNHKFLDEQDVERIAYMVSFLVSKGWNRKATKFDPGDSFANEEYNDKSYLWSKEGCTQDLTVYSKYYCEQKMVTTELFTLEDAFYKESGDYQA